MRAIWLCACLLGTLVGGCGAPEADRLELAQLESMDPVAARLTFEAMELSSRVAVVRARFAQTLVEGHFDEEQAAFVHELGDRAAEILSSDARARAYEARAMTVLSEAQRGALFGRLGKAPLVEHFVDEAGLAPQRAQPTCTDSWVCSNECSCHTAPHQCVQNTCSSNCTTTSSGCGWFWSQSCNKSASSTPVSSCSSSPP